ncbi:hypothetical protein ABPG75_005169 [Micractinium tetrahymenae]
MQQALLDVGKTQQQHARTRRRLAAVVEAAAAPQPPLPTTGRAARQQLVRSLAQQAVKEAWDGWLGDLVLPLLTDNPGTAAPPPRTVPPRQLADPDSRFVEVEGVTLHYKEAWPSSSSSGTNGNSNNGSSDAGSGAAGSSATGSLTLIQQQARPAAARPTVLLVHGLNGSTFNWRATMQPLADATGCRVLAFDRTPYGLAQRPLSWGGRGQALQFNPYTTEGSARLTEGLLDALAVGPVVAVGHSAGAIVCMELAQRQPDRVAALGFVAPALPTTPENSWLRSTLGAQLRLLAVRAIISDDRLGLRYVRRQILRRRDEVAAGDLRLHAEGFEDVVNGYLRPLRAIDWDRASLLNFRAFSLPPSYDYAALHQPVLLGSEDGMLTRNARELARLLRARPAGETRFVKLQGRGRGWGLGIGHVPMDECPSQLNRLLIDFVRQQVTAPAGPAGSVPAGSPPASAAAGPGQAVGAGA